MVIAIRLPDVITCKWLKLTTISKIGNSPAQSLPDVLRALTEFGQQAGDFTWPLAGMS